MAVELTYHVVVNHEEQYSIWPDMRGTPPEGWRVVGKQGTETECLDYIEKVWTDMRPLSLRREMEAAEREFTGAEELPEAPSGPSLVDRLTKGEQAISLVFRPEASRDAFWEAVNRGYLNVAFHDTQGGTELTVALDPSSGTEDMSDQVRLVGRVTLDYEPIVCALNLDLASFSGTSVVKRAEGTATHG